MAIYAMTNTHQSKFIRDAVCSDFMFGLRGLNQYFKHGEKVGAVRHLLAGEWDDVYTGDYEDFAGLLRFEQLAGASSERVLEKVLKLRKDPVSHVVFLDEAMKVSFGFEYRWLAQSDDVR